MGRVQTTAPAGAPPAVARAAACRAAALANRAKPKAAGRNPSRLYGNGGEARYTIPLPIKGKKL